MSDNYPPGVQEHMIPGMTDVDIEWDARCPQCGYRDHAMEGVGGGWIMYFTCPICDHEFEIEVEEVEPDEPDPDDYDEYDNH